MCGVVRAHPASFFDMLRRLRRVEGIGADVFSLEKILREFRATISVSIFRMRDLSLIECQIHGKNYPNFDIAIVFSALAMARVPMLRALFPFSRYIGQVPDIFNRFCSPEVGGEAGQKELFIDS